MKYETYDKYEYMWPNLSGYSIKGILEQFNKLGQEGWEVISFSLNSQQALLKRKITVLEV
jgi:hypothetical protein